MRTIADEQRLQKLLTDIPANVEAIMQELTEIVDAYKLNPKYMEDFKAQAILDLVEALPKYDKQKDISGWGFFVRVVLNSFKYQLRAAKNTYFRSLTNYELNAYDYNSKYWRLNRLGITVTPETREKISAGVKEWSATTRKNRTAKPLH